MDQKEMLAQAKAADMMALELLSDIRHTPLNQKLTIVVAMFSKIIEDNDWNFEKRLGMVSVVCNALTISISLGELKNDDRRP